MPEHWTVGHVIDYLRADDDLTTDFWEVFVVDPAHQPVGTCQLSLDPAHAARRSRIADVMKREQTLIPVDMDQEEVALRFQKYALISAAVVDRRGRLVGMITVDDVVHIIQEEAGEDILLLSGAGRGRHQRADRRQLQARACAGWSPTSAPRWSPRRSSACFEGAIEQMVALAALMPIVAGVGGNAGTQTLAVTVRALATNQLTDPNSWRAVWREIAIALLNGGDDRAGDRHGDRRCASRNPCLAG